jgi:hypothetical protein
MTNQQNKQFLSFLQENMKKLLKKIKMMKKRQIMINKVKVDEK